MFDRLRKHLTFNNILLIGATILVLSWTWTTVGAISKNHGLEQKINDARLEADVLELQNENLRLEQAYFQTDEYLELQARRLLNKALPGEHLVILPKTTIEENPVVEDETTPERSNFEQWMEFLFGRKT